MTRKTHLHRSHPEVIKRLKRLDGHLRGVIEMIHAGKPCLDVAQQLHAVEKAIAEAKKTFIQDHLDQCLENVARPLVRKARRSVDEFKEITKYL